MRRGGTLQLLQKPGFNPFRIEIHLAGGDFVVAGAHKAQFADTHSVGSATHRRPECAARDRPRGVEIASTCLRVEGRAWVVVHLIRELDVLVREQPGQRVAGKISGYPGDSPAGTFAHPGGAQGIGGFQFGQALAQPARIELGDLKRTHATLETAWAANQPSSALARGFGQRRVHDLDQPTIARIYPRLATHSLRIAAAGGYGGRPEIDWNLNSGRFSLAGSWVPGAGAGGMMTARWERER
jgi:hypothetical protein